MMEHHIDLKSLTLCRESGPWIDCKHSIIREYLPSFLISASKALKRAYVDLYSGPGCNVIRPSQKRVLGSPIIALDKANELANTVKLKYDKQPLLEFFFNDLKSEHVEQLRYIASQYFPNAYVHYFSEDANNVISTILSDIHPKTPTFFVLDPEGSELYWSTIEAISMKERADLLINFPLGGLKRLIGRDDEPSHAIVTRVFGTDAWKSVAQTEGGEIRGPDLFSLYLRRLTSLGFETASSQDSAPDRVAKNTKNVPLYYLIFAAKGPKSQVPLRIARNIFSRDCSGQPYLFH